MKKPVTLLIVILFLFANSPTFSQNLEKDWRVGLFAGAINYQGDLKPNSFTFNHSNLAVQLTARKPVNRWISLKTGFSIGKIEGADKYNRDYLMDRNLSFATTIKELFAGIEIDLDNYNSAFSPYIYGGGSIFHFNPWTYDANGKKTFLKPLSTEGQGLPDYPGQKPYKLIQPAFAFGIGARYSLNSYITVGMEFSQRKTFFDYLDDVSTFYVDEEKLMAARGAKAVELAYRGDELPGGNPYPHSGYQRGTATEMDWYYFIGFTLEIKLTNALALLAGWKGDPASFSYFLGCPKNF